MNEKSEAKNKGEVKPDGGPAFPIPLRDGERWVGSGTEFGMSLRQYYAGLAMQGLMSNLADIRKEGFKDSHISEFARIQADALIAELNS